MSRIKERYQKEVKAKLKEKLGLKNIHQVPKLEKIVISCVNRDACSNGKVVEAVCKDLTLISGQKAMIARAKKSVASFKLREGQAMGGFVTLRGQKMYDFFDRLITFSLPRVRDFRGVSAKGFDGRGNYTLGIKEHIVFPEIDYDKIDKVRGLGIVFVTSAKTNDQGRELLRELGMPFKAS